MYVSQWSFLKALFDYEDNFSLKVDYFNSDFSGKGLAKFANETMEKIIRIQHCPITLYHEDFLSIFFQNAECISRYEN